MEAGDRVDDIEPLTSGLVHLARIALQGDERQIQAFVRRLARQEKRRNPALAAELATLVEGAASSTMNATRATGQLVPVDGESRLDLLRIEHPSFAIDRPVLLPTVRRRIEQVLDERQHLEGLLEVGLEPSRTVLFTGPPGVGKTLCARWIAKELRQPLFTLDLASVMSSFLGRTGANVRAVLDFAKRHEGVLLLDEFDAVAKRRADDTEVGELKRLVTVLLQEIDQWPSDRLLIAATNHGELLDPAVWRRFDMVVEFPLPAAEDMVVLAQKELGGLVGANWTRMLGTMMSGQSFSDLARLSRAVRRQSVISGESVEKKLLDVLHEQVGHLSKSDLKKIAIQLEAAGIAQRQISDLTGLSRDTIRKARTELEAGNG
jgi:SpoVK/Ycf46/Vps4 family AAA+-type ATPase